MSDGNMTVCSVLVKLSFGIIKEILDNLLLIISPLLSDSGKLVLRHKKHKAGVVY